MASPDWPSHLNSVPIGGIDTPALLIDLSAFQSNTARIARQLQDRGLQWRPRFESHPVRELRDLQIQAGARGLSVASLDHAEQEVMAGARNVLLNTRVTESRNLQRVIQLCRTGSLLICCDHYVHAEALSRACLDADVTCRLLIEINIGMNCMGVRPGPDAQQLARAILRLPGVELVGITGCLDHTGEIEGFTAQRRAWRASLGMLGDANHQFRKHGLPATIVHAAGPFVSDEDVTSSGVTEWSPAGDLLNEPTSQAMIPATEQSPTERSPAESASAVRLLTGTASGDSPSADRSREWLVLATVLSRPKLERAVLDCGSRLLSVTPDTRLAVRRVEGRALTDATVTQISPDLTTLELAPIAQELHIGDRVLLRPGPTDSIPHSFSGCYGLQQDRILGPFTSVPRASG